MKEENKERKKAMMWKLMSTYRLPKHVTSLLKLRENKGDLDNEIALNPR